MQKDKGIKLSKFVKKIMQFPSKNASFKFHQTFLILSTRTRPSHYSFNPHSIAWRSYSLNIIPSSANETFFIARLLFVLYKFLFLNIYVLFCCNFHCIIKKGLSFHFKRKYKKKLEVKHSCNPSYTACYFFYI